MLLSLTSDTPHKQQLWTQGGECVRRPGTAVLGKAATLKFRDNTHNTTHEWKAWLQQAAHEHVHCSFGWSSCALKTTQRSIHKRESANGCAQPAAEHSALKTASRTRIDTCAGQSQGSHGTEEPGRKRGHAHVSTRGPVVKGQK